MVITAIGIILAIVVMTEKIAPTLFSKKFMIPIAKTVIKAKGMRHE